MYTTSVRLNPTEEPQTTVLSAWSSLGPQDVVTSYVSPEPHSTPAEPFLLLTGHAKEGSKSDLLTKEENNDAACAHNT